MVQNVHMCFLSVVCEQVPLLVHWRLVKRPPSDSNTWNKKIHTKSPICPEVYVLSEIRRIQSSVFLSVIWEGTSYRHIEINFMKGNRRYCYYCWIKYKNITTLTTLNWKNPPRRTYHLFWNPMEFHFRPTHDEVPEGGLASIDNSVL